MAQIYSAPDTDGDIIEDGYEVQNLSMMNITQELEHNLHSKDYNNDGLPDGFEIHIAY